MVCGKGAKIQCHWHTQISGGYKDPCWPAKIVTSPPVRKNCSPIDSPGPPQWVQALEGDTSRASRQENKNITCMSLTWLLPHWAENAFSRNQVPPSSMSQHLAPLRSMILSKEVNTLQSRGEGSGETHSLPGLSQSVPESWTVNPRKSRSLKSH